MSPDQVKVILALDEGGDDFGYYDFASLSAETGLDRKRVRRAARALARKGYAEFGKGLWSEDGEPAGSGYAITKAGRSVPEVVAKRERETAERMAIIASISALEPSTLPPGDTNDAE